MLVFRLQRYNINDIIFFEVWKKWMILGVSNTQQSTYQQFTKISPFKKGGQNIEVSFIQSFQKRVFFGLFPSFHIPVFTAFHPFFRKIHVYLVVIRKSLKFVAIIIWKKRL